MNTPFCRKPPTPKNLLGELLHSIATFILISCSVALSVCATNIGLCGDKRSVPNIVLILADDLGYAELGCYGQKKIHTPRIDEMAAAGMRFTDFYSGNPVCATSRCVLMTGKHPGHAEIRDNREAKPEGQHPISAETVTVAELLKTQGYATAAIGKWGLGPVGSTGDPNKHGFDLFYGFNCQRHAHNHYPTYVWRNDQRETLAGNTNGPTGEKFTHDLLEQESLKFIRQSQDQPFFLYVPFLIPHVAIQVPDDSLAEYKGKIEDAPYVGGQGYLPHPHPHAGYAAMVTRMDLSVGRILDLLNELKLAENTLVIFTSDNGPTHGRVGGADSAFFESAGDLRGLKGSCYEGGIRVPFIAQWPGKIKAGTTSNLPGGFYDMLPTLCDVAGVNADYQTDGVSIVPTLFDEGKQEVHDFLYWEFPGYGGQQAVRMGEWKGIRPQLGKGKTQIEVYHLPTDIGEQNDVSAEHPEITAKIEAIMKREHVPSATFPLQAIDSPIKPKSAK